MHSPDLTACLNCDAELTGPYCAQCGQHAVELRPSTHDLLHDAFHEISHVDSKIIRTTGLLLFRPGALTREFLEGKRARSVSPIRLYLLCSLLFFSVVAVLPPSNLHVRITKGGDAQLRQAAEKMNRDPAILGHALTASFPKAMFVLMPLFGLIVYAFYFRKERLYVPHLYFAVHYHAFAFVMLTVFEVLSAIHLPAVGVVRPLIFLTAVPYLAIALRRVYGGGPFLTSAKVAAIFVIYGLFVLSAMVAITYVTLRRLT